MDDDATFHPVATESEAHPADHAHTADLRPIHSASFGSRVLRQLRRLAPRSCQSVSGWPLLATYFLLTFAQEVPTTAVGLLIVNALAFEPADETKYYAATFVPWTIRPVYAFLSDQLPLFSYRRRPYFILGAVCACAMQVCLAVFGTSQHSFWGLGVATQLFIAVCEVACDSLSVEWGNELATRLLHYQAKRRQQDQATVGNAPSPLAPAEAHSPSTRARQEWSAPLLAEEQETLVRVESTESTPLNGLPTAASASGGYSTLRDRVHRVHVQPASASPVQSIGVQYESNPLDTTPRMAAMTDRVFAHLLASTPDVSTLTSLVIKSRIQTECMSIRTFGSVVASATSILMLLYLEPRTVLLWSSLVFLAGIVSLAWYAQERKIHAGYFFLADLGETTTILLDLAVFGTDTIRHTVHEHPATHQLQTLAQQEDTSCQPPQQQQPHQSSENDRPGATAPTALMLPAHPTPSDAAAVGVSKVDSLDSRESNWLCGMPLSRWLFLYRKVASLFSALWLLKGPLLFIFLLNAMPSSEDAYYNYLYSQYSKFLSWQFGLFNFIGLAGSLVGCLIYQSGLARTTRWNMSTIFLWTTTLASVVGCSTIFLATKTNRLVGLNDQSFVIISSFTVSLFGMLAQLPPLILATHYAPKGFGLEASMFSLFAAAAHLGSLVSAAWSVALIDRYGLTQDDFSNLWKLILVCNCVALAPLALMPCLLRGKTRDQAERSAAEEQRTAATAVAAPMDTPPAEPWSPLVAAR